MHSKIHYFHTPAVVDFPGSCCGFEQGLTQFQQSTSHWARRADSMILMRIVYYSDQRATMMGQTLVLVELTSGECSCSEANSQAGWLAYGGG
jgi:hypothetical protein